MAEYQDSSLNSFYDIFRRADKNDDGAISWKEFKSYFADGIFSEKELEKLFSKIDTHGTNNIDISELSEYFSQHLGSFKEVLTAMETLNRTVSTVLNETSVSYGKANKEEQYISRFFLRESLSQIAAMQGSLEIACEHIDSTSDRQIDDNCSTVTNGKPADDALKCVQPGRYGRRNRRQITEKGTHSIDESELSSQVDRLKQLIDRFENNITMDTGPEEVLNIEHEHLNIMINRKYDITEGSLKDFQTQLRKYVEYMNESDSLAHFSVRTFKSGLRHSLYEIWSSKVALDEHLSSTEFVEFNEVAVSCSDKNETNTISIPSSWIENKM